MSASRFASLRAPIHYVVRRIRSRPTRSSPPRYAGDDSVGHIVSSAGLMPQLSQGNRFISGRSIYIHPQRLINNR